MSRDDIIRMAIKCQLVTTSNRDGVYADALERFAALVAAAEREACAKACEDAISPHVTDSGGMKLVTLALAAAIRKRGEVKP